MKNTKNGNLSLVRFQLGEAAGLTLGDVGDHMLGFYGRGGLEMGGCYFPPILEAPFDSSHNYNVINSRRIDPKLGGEAGFRAAATVLRQAGLEVWLDLVPNHQHVPWEWLQMLKRRELPNRPIGEQRPDANALWESEMRNIAFDINLDNGWWRRFFDIEDLVGMNVEHPCVFRLTHEVYFPYFESGLVSGARVDHPGGLKRPCKYLRDLRDAGARSIVVEAVLLGDEMPPAHWKIDGCVGYPFMRRARGLFVDPVGVQSLKHAYDGACQDDPNRQLVSGDFHDCARAAKRCVAENVLKPEVEWLTSLLGDSGPASQITAALAALDVYRCYADPQTNFVPPVCRDVINRSSIHPRLKAILLLQHRGEGSDLARLNEFVYRFQQWTGPVTAMGVENTAFFRYGLLPNDVGSDPSQPWTTLEDFHRFNQLTQHRYPRRFNPVATHDNKWGHWPVSRMNALTLIPGRFGAFYDKWNALNRDLRTNGAPDNRLEWQIYQALVGFWPYDIKLFKVWLEKTMKEAKLQTNWITPNREWEDGVYKFVEALYESPACAGFRQDLEELVAEVDPLARHAGLGQLVLMMTAPGRPVFYQGDPFWEMQGVDPLNRLRQDREGQAKLLARVPRPDSTPDRDTDRVVLIKRGNILRRELPEVFGEDGDYEAIDEGPGVFSFARGPQREVIVQVVPQSRYGRKRVPAGYHDLLPELPHGLFVRNGLTQTFGS
jgi:(1->4)-alpha-D-glucan 1-alpha-D-glucosylmutase